MTAPSTAGVAISRTEPVRARRDVGDHHDHPHHDHHDHQHDPPGRRPAAQRLHYDPGHGPTDSDETVAELRVVREQAGVDEAGVVQAATDLLRALGRDTNSPHLADTPRRIAAAYVELLSPRPFELTTFANDDGYDGLVLVRDIPVHSLCAHHLLPFNGVAHVAYLPADRILGLSKLARVVEMFARDLQVQERLTQQVANWLQEHLEPQGVGVVIEAEHLCMSMRGVQVSGTLTLTSALHGLMREDPRTRQEFFDLVRRS